MRTYNLKISPKLLINFENIKVFPGLFILIWGVMLIGVSIMVGTAKFSADSWSYIELANTVFGKEFYSFNTYRSYLSDYRSAAFPPVYPVMIAILRFFFGPYPILAIGLNIIVGTVTGLLLVSIAKEAGLNLVMQASLSLSMLLYGPYLEEVLAGRSMPLAIIFFVGSCRAILSRRYLLAGLFLGFASITRFDFLAYALLFQAGLFFLYFSKSKSKLFCYTMIGFISGIIPWIIYSEIFFSRLWVADNSWVATSITHSFVLDFPATSLTLFDSPGAWFSRVIRNLPKLVQSVIGASLDYPLIIILLFLRIFQSVERRKVQYKNIVISSLALISLAPYALTGYYDYRYFTLFFLVISFFIASQLRYFKAEIKSASRLFLLILIIPIAFGVFSLERIIQYAIVNKNRIAFEDKFISSLWACQKQQPKVRYIFSGKAHYLAAKYGAITGGRSAFIPSNFELMESEERHKYFMKMMPYKIVGSITESDLCN
jgi:hypothetical protein